MTDAEKKRLPRPLYGIEKKRRLKGLSDSDIAWDSYFIPGTDTMRNSLGSSERSYGITDAAKLSRLETALSQSRMNELLTEQVEISGDYDLDHMRAIHRHLFQDVYPWAGEPRIVGMNKASYESGNPIVHSYDPPQFIERHWDGLAQRLADDDHLRGITDQNAFTDQLAAHWGAINYVHAFREGNTRSQTMFFQQLSRQAGWELDVSMLAPDHPRSVRDQFIAGRYRWQDDFNAGRLSEASSQPLADALRPAISPSPEKQREIDRAQRAQQDTAAKPSPIMQRPTDPSEDRYDKTRRALSARVEDLAGSASMADGYDLR